MADIVAKIAKRAIEPSDVRIEGSLTAPRSYGVYQVPYAATSDNRFHFGNYPVRLQELEREFGSCTLTYLFSSREDAEAIARALNGREV